MKIQARLGCDRPCKSSRLITGTIPAKNLVELKPISKLVGKGIRDFLSQFSLVAHSDPKKTAPRTSVPRATLRPVFVPPLEVLWFSTFHFSWLFFGAANKRKISQSSSVTRQNKNFCDFSFFIHHLALTLTAKKSNEFFTTAGTALAAFTEISAVNTSDDCGNLKNRNSLRRWKHHQHCCCSFFLSITLSSDFPRC